VSASARTVPKLQRPMKLTIRPVTPERWPDLEAVFNARGCSGARGCWCMFYRRRGAAGPLPAGMTRAKRNRADLKALVDSGRPPGLIAYEGKVPVGWVTLGPREEFGRLERSPVMKPVDDKPVWSVVCFVVPSAHRRQGATLLEAYPVDKRGRSSDENMWFGAKSMYDGAGFKEVARRKPARPIVRRKVRGATRRSPST
jgi:hypothetical protein